MKTISELGKRIQAGETSEIRRNVYLNLLENRGAFLKILDSVSYYLENSSQEALIQLQNRTMTQEDYIIHRRNMRNDRQIDEYDLDCLCAFQEYGF